MSGAETVREKQWLVSHVLRCMETDISGARLVVAEDLRLRADIHRDQMLEAWKALEELLDDPSVSSADLKGLLNRVDVGWSVESPFGANAQAAREHIEAARDAIHKWAEAL